MDFDSSVRRSCDAGQRSPDLMGIGVSNALQSQIESFHLSGGQMILIRMDIRRLGAKLYINTAVVGVNLVGP